MTGLEIVGLAVALLAGFGLGNAVGTDLVRKKLFAPIFKEKDLERLCEMSLALEEARKEILFRELSRDIATFDVDRAIQEATDEIRESRKVIDIMSRRNGWAQDGKI